MAQAEEVEVVAAVEEVAVVQVDVLLERSKKLIVQETPMDL